MYLFVLGNFPLSLFIFTQFFFQDRIQHCLLQNLNYGEISTYFIIMFCLGSSATYFAVNSREWKGHRVIEIGFLKCEERQFILGVERKMPISPFYKKHIQRKK